MKLIKLERGLPWLPEGSEARVVLTSELPPRHLITSVHAFAFEADKLLMTCLTDRHWDIPGGHLEPGEQPEEALRREVLEETCARLGPLRIFAARQIRAEGPRPPFYFYPWPESYQVFYRAEVLELEPFRPTEECSDRGFFPPQKVRALPWIERNRELYEAALASA